MIMVIMVIIVIRLWSDCDEDGNQIWSLGWTDAGLDDHFLPGPGKDFDKALSFKQ